ncbi:hypothetical protein PS15m_011191 [Mucor circinelloides]
MPENTKKLSCKQYLKENSEKFSLVTYYEYFNFDTRQSAENSLRGAVFASNDFEYLKNPAAEAFWSKLEARYSQIKRTYDQTRVQAETESALLQDIQENISKIEKNLPIRKENTKLTVEDRLSLSSIMMIKDVSPLTKYTLSENIFKMIEEWQSAIEEKKRNFYSLCYANLQWGILHVCHAFIHLHQH